MRVLFLTKHDPLRYGQAQVLRHLAPALGSQGISVEVFSGDRAAAQMPLDSPYEVPLHFGVLPIPSRRGWRQARRDLEALCRERSFDVVHAHGLHHAGNAARLLKRRLALPFLVTSHGDISEARRMRRWRFRNRCRRVIRQASGITHLSASMEERARAFGVPFALSEVIPNGVDLRAWSQHDADAAPDPDPKRAVPYVLAAGRLVAQKGFALLVDALALLREQEAPAPALIILGEGEEREVLAERAQRLDVPCVRHPRELLPELGPSLCLAGFASGAAKRALFRGALAIALPSLHGEASPLVVPEALAAGTPALASDIPSLRALIVPEETGLLVKPGDPAAWAAACSRVASDPTLQARTRDASARRLPEHDWPRLAARYGKLYRQISGFHEKPTWKHENPA